MKATLAALAFVTASSAFQIVEPISSRSSSFSALSMAGFLDGKGKKVTIREDEDEKMWFDLPKKKKVVAPLVKTAAPVKAVAKKGPAKPDLKKKPPVKEAPKAAGFKFPWDK